jgi:hypothetical protein
MLVYGDSIRIMTPGEALEGIAGACDRAAATTGRARHDHLVEALIEAGELLQAMADEGLTAAERAATDLVMHGARAVLASWDHGFCAPWLDPAPALAAVAASAPRQPVRMRSPEGYAFYAVRPEAYADAARRVFARTDPVRVIGIRSIGASLAAMVAAALGVDDFVTVRPGGHPFARELSVPDDLRDRLVPRQGLRYAIVDEGPGLSGSSFGSVADALERLGVSADAITFFPSHGGEPGPQASERHRGLWARVRRTPCGYDPAGPGALSLVDAVAELIGPLDEPLRDLSGGRWRAERDSREGPFVAVPHQERLKFLARSAGRTYLLKFAGLGRIGRGKIERARLFAEAGLGLPPVGLVHGFLIEPWIEGARCADLAADGPALLDAASRWLILRSSMPARPEAGAGLADLLDMIVHNAGFALGDGAARWASEWRSRLPALEGSVRRVQTDGRWHAWEWLRLPDGAVLKTDVLDHGEAHDLIGAQDIAWDIAGAALELGLDERAVGDLVSRLEKATGRSVPADLLAFFRVAYPAFQLGLFTLAAGSVGDRSSDEACLKAQVERYREAISQAISAI